MREAAPEHRADLRDLPRGAEPVEPRGERLLQGRRDRLRAALDAALQEEARHLLDEQRHAAGALIDALDDIPRQRVAGRDFADHPCDLRAIERRERDHAMVRAHAPRRAEFRPHRRNQKQRRLGAALGQGLHEIERGRVGPVQVLEGEHDRLASARPPETRPSSPPIAGGAIPPAQISPRRSSGSGTSTSGAMQGRIFGRVQADQPQSVLEIGEALFGGQVRAEPQAAPFCDRVQRRILQQLRRRPFHPGVRRLAEPRAKLLDQPRLADARARRRRGRAGLRRCARAPSAGLRCRAPPRVRRAA